ncbi:phosphoribosylformylglycinamidine synthase I [Nanoarchaeota archaeon]
MGQWLQGGNAMRIAVIWYPGTNCDEEAFRAIEAAGMKPEIVRWNTDVSGYDGYMIPGGWSYEDRIRAGVIAAKHPVMKTIKKEAEAGKPVLGICNGAQVLIETGLVPGLKDKVQMALAPNNDGYYCIWTNLLSTSKQGRCAYNKKLKQGDVIKAPIAHGEGRFTTRDAELVKELEKNGQIIFKYCDADGKVTDEANPNGAIFNIAGICNPEGNVMAMMPHPERAAWYKNIPYHEGKSFEENEKTTLSNAVFESMKEFINGN